MHLQPHLLLPWPLPALTGQTCSYHPLCLELLPHDAPWKSSVNSAPQVFLSCDALWKPSPMVPFGEVLPPHAPWMHLPMVFPGDPLLWCSLEVLPHNPPWGCSPMALPRRSSIMVLLSSAWSHPSRSWAPPSAMAEASPPRLPGALHTWVDTGLGSLQRDGSEQPYSRPLKRPSLVWEELATKVARA